jgi:hypothetical protein
MKISLCTTTASLLGDLLLDTSDNQSTLDYLARRVSRVATLDGGSVIIDNGFSVADGKFKLVIDPEKNSVSLYRQLSLLISQYSLFTIACHEGVFLGTLENANNNKTLLTLNFLITQQLA